MKPPPGASATFVSLLLLLLLVSCLVGMADVSAAVVPAHEKSALLDLYRATNGPQWFKNDGWQQAAAAGFGDPCGGDGADAWSGVVCDANGTHVLHLNLYNNNLNGTIPASLADVTRLEWLRLPENPLWGTIPAALGSLAHLKMLRLFDTSVEGTLPPSLGRLGQLTEMYITGTRLEGTLPSWLGNLTQLTVLFLQSNRLHGTIPPEVGELQHLQRLALNDNGLYGTLPPSLGKLSQLIVLQLHDNQLEGTMPPTLGDLANVNSVKLQHNRLRGTLPSTLGNLTQLMELHMENNSLEGTVPVSLLTNANLRLLVLNDNALTGDVPPLYVAGPYRAISPSLQELHLQNNRLSGWNTSVETAGTGPSHVSRTLQLLDVRNNDIDADLDTEDYYLKNTLQAAVSLVSFHIANNTRLRFSISAMVEAVSTTSLDVSYTAAYGTLDSPNLRMSLKSLGANSCDGVLGALPITRGSGPLQLIDVRGTSMRAPATPSGVRGNSLPVYLRGDGPPEPFFDLSRDRTATCTSVLPATRDAADFIVALIDPAYDGYVRCGCVAGYSGIGVNCTACSSGSWSAANQSVCEPCGPGTYQPAGVARTSPASCVPCPAGTATALSGTGQSGCTLCDAGTVAQRGSSECIRCGAGQYAASATTCSTCAVGSFTSSNSTGTRCHKCIEGMVCGAGDIAIAAGRWWPHELHVDRSDDYDNSAVVLYHCLSDSPTACPAPNASAIAALKAGGGIAAVCGIGHKQGSPLCAVCDHGYARSIAAANHACVACPATWVTVCVAAFAVCCFFAFLLFALHVDGRRRLRVSTAVGKSSSEVRGNTRSALRTLISYLQMVALAASFRQHASSLVRRALVTAASAGGDSIATLASTPLDCASNVGFLGQLAVTAALPPLAMIVVIVWVFVRMRSPCSKSLRHTSAPTKHELVAGGAAVGFLLYTRVTRTALAALKNHGQAIDGSTYLEADFRITTTSPTYKAMVGVAVGMLALYTVVAPVAAFAQLWRARAARATHSSSSPGASNHTESLLASSERGKGADEGADEGSLLDGGGGVETAGDNVLLLHPLGMLTRGYRPSVWWWESTVVGRKVAFAAISVFVTDEQLQTFMGAMLLMALLCLHMRYQPFNDAQMNNAESAALVSLYVTTLSGMLYAHLEVAGGDSAAGAETDANAVLSTSLTALLLVLNGGTVSYLAWLWVRELRARRFPCSRCRGRRPRPRASSSAASGLGDGIRGGASQLAMVEGLGGGAVGNTRAIQ